MLLRGKQLISFDIDYNFILEKQIFLKEHPNGMKFIASDTNGNIILEETYFSVGGGTIARKDEISQKIERKPLDVPYQFSSFAELKDICIKIIFKSKMLYWQMNMLFILKMIPESIFAKLLK